MSETNQVKKTRFIVKARPMGGVPSIVPATLSDHDTDLEVEEFKKVTQQLRKLKQ